MTRHKTLTHRPADCHWSVPVCLFHSMPDGDDEIETFWVCERTEEHRRVSKEECSRCRHRAPEQRRMSRKVS